MTVPAATSESAGTAASPPTLVLAAHGTRSLVGSATTHALADVVQSLRPQLDVRVSFVDVAEPTFAQVVAAAEGPIVVVPALLSAGYHVHIDIPRVLRERTAPANTPALITPALGPDPVLSELLALRLAEACCARPAPSVVLVATGSSDVSARADVAAAGADLAAQLHRPVRTCFMSGPDADLDDALGPDVDVATYLLAEGAFYDRLRRTALDAGVPTVSAPLGVHPRLAELVLRRYDDALKSSACSGDGPVR